MKDNDHFAQPKGGGNFHYSPPELTLLQIGVEAGFAATGPSIPSAPDDWQPGDNFWPENNS